MDILKDNSERILSIDFGEKRIGIAISDPLKMFAIPLVTINNTSKFWIELKKTISQYNIIHVVIGYPYKDDGSKSNIATQIEKFAEELSSKLNLNYEFIDERYSSSIAWEQILRGVPSKKKRRDKSLIDKNAAAVILQDYLKSNEKTG
jgi:putative Holliday junction resolvase